MPTINCLTYDPGSDDNSQQNYKNVASCGAFPSCPDRRRFVKFTDVPGRRAFLSPSVKTGMIEVIKMDLHGYHPSEIVQTDVLKKIIQQTWEMGENYLTLIHGHGRNRGISPGFFNTNTGYFGLEIRRALRHDKELRQWIRYTTLDCSHMGVTRPSRCFSLGAKIKNCAPHDFRPKMGEAEGRSMESSVLASTSLTDLYRAYIDCLNRQDWDELGQYVDDEVEHNGRPLKLSGYRDMLVQDFEDIPDLRFNIQLLLSSPPVVAARLAFRCSPKGKFLGLSVNGRMLSFAENVFYEFRLSKIASVWSVIDKAAIEAQLPG